MRTIVAMGMLLCATLVSAQQGEIRRGYYADGTLRYEGYFADGAPVGEMTRYYPDGTVQAKLIHRGDTADAVLYAKGEEYVSQGRYVRHKKEDEWQYKKGDRVVSTETYHLDALEGVARKFYANGTAAEEKNWKSGMPDGVWRTYYPDGVLRLEAVYAHGRLEGTMRGFNPDGRLVAEGAYRNGLREGEWRYYAADGKESKVRVYTAGVAADQEEEDIEESRQMDKMLEESSKIVDPSHFTDQPEMYLKLTHE